jgi:arylsulfatase A-like enzyme
MVSGVDGASPARVEANASLIDVLPTLIDLLGLPRPEGVEGLSLAPWIRPSIGGTKPAHPERTIFAHRARLEGDLHLWAAIEGPWKLVQLGDKDSVLFNLERDPGELEDVAAKHPDIVERLEHALRGFRVETFGTPEDAIDVVLDDELIEEMRALGYVDD